MQQILKDYSKRIPVGGAIAALIISLLSPLVIMVPSASAMSGSGSMSSPYLVTSCSDFKQLPTDNAANYALTQDIDCSADGNSVMDAGPFTGTFTGNGHVIIVNIDSSDTFVGLFGQLDGATVSNLTIAGSIQSNNGPGTDIGGLAGQMNNTTVDRVTISATVTLLYNSSGYTGGLTGFMISSIISNVAVTGDVLSYDQMAGGLFGLVACGVSVSDSYSSGNVSANGDYAGGIAASDGCQGPTTTYSRVHSTGTIVADGSQVGGLIGAANWVILNDSYATGYIEGIDSVGGLVGIAASNAAINRSYASADVYAFGTYAGGLVGSLQYGSSIDQSFASGSVNADIYGAGGLVGYYDGGSGSSAIISNSYARGAVTGDQAGGLIGAFDTGAVVTSYATGSVDTSQTDHGGLVGVDIGEPTDSLFWDTQTSGNASSGVGTGKTTAQMKSLATYTSAATPGIGAIWDFVNNPNNDTATNDVWNMQSSSNDGYPCLMWVAGCAPLPVSAPIVSNAPVANLLGATTTGSLRAVGAPNTGEGRVSSMTPVLALAGGLVLVAVSRRQLCKSLYAKNPKV